MMIRPATMTAVARTHEAFRDNCAMIAVPVERLRVFESGGGAPPGPGATTEDVL
jgi:hypothetical protein